VRIKALDIFPLGKVLFLVVLEIDGNLSVGKFFGFYFVDTFAGLTIK